MPDEYTTEEVAAMLAKPKRNKMNAKRTEYNGRWYDSKAEASYAASLDMLAACGDIDCWLRQVPIDLGADARYTVDFLVHDKAGLRAVEVKGQEREGFRRNVKLWRKHGPFPLHIVKRGRTTEIVEGASRA